MSSIVLHHPVEVVDSAESTLFLAMRWFRKKPLKPESLRIREPHLGRTVDPGTAITGCAAIYEKRAPDAAWLDSLRQRYGRAGTRVLIDVTPLPPCAPSLGFYQDALKPGMVDNRLTTQPLETFSSSGRQHMMESGVRMMSNAVADQILELEKGAH